MQLDLHYTNELLVSIYDIENSGRHDIDFYLDLARSSGAGSAVDLGCGTGVLACDLATAGLQVAGVDPAGPMLDVARSRPGGRQVAWVQGDSSMLEPLSTDLVVMTGHVAQVFLTDDDWDAVLRDCRRALRPGGHLAFETRNPDLSPWRRWTKQDTFERFPLPDGGSFSSWVEVTGVRGPLVDFEGHNAFSRPAGELPPEPETDLIATSTLRFRTRAQVQESLACAGFGVSAVYGAWDRGPVEPDSRELIFLAQLP